MVLTLITTFGLMHNAYRNHVQSEVTLDDLFRCWDLSTVHDKPLRTGVAVFGIIQLPCGWGMVLAFAATSIFDGGCGIPVAAAWRRLGHVPPQLDLRVTAYWASGGKAVAKVRNVEEGIYFEEMNTNEIISRVRRGEDSVTQFKRQDFVSTSGCADGQDFITAYMRGETRARVDNAAALTTKRSCS